MALQNRGPLGSTTGNALSVLTYGELLARVVQGTVNPINAAATAVAGVRNTIDGTNAAYTVTLPAPTFIGQPLLIERIDTTTVNTVAVQGATGATIEGSTTRVVNYLAVGVANESTLFVAESLTSWAIAGAHKPAAWINAYVALYFEPKGLSTATAASLSATYSPLLPPVGALTYDGSGNVTGDSSGVTYTYNLDGSVATITKAGLTRTLSYNADGTIGAVA